jgi:penicillin-binding protein-related factor A (putative recombinase)
MTIHNIKNKGDLITLDISTKQIRYLKDIKKQGEILFLPLSNSDIEGYEYLFNQIDYSPDNLNLFKDTLKEDLKSFLNIDININNLEVLN